MSGLGDIDQKALVAGRQIGRLASALELLKTMPMDETKKKIAIVGSGAVGMGMANACRELGLEVFIFSAKDKELNSERGKAMAFAFDPELAFLQPTPMQKLEMEFIGKVREADMRRPRFEFLTERLDDNACVFPNGFKIELMARELAGVPNSFRGINPDSFISDVYPEKKLPRKAKKAYIAKYGRAEYRRMYRG